jgi:hypothetical protein
MVPLPVVLGLTFCDQVIVEEGTRKVSLIGTFSGIRGPSFPFLPRPFAVFAVLTDGDGEGEVELTVTRLESDQEVYSQRQQVRFAGRFVQMQVLFRLHKCVFPAPGQYLFTLLLDGEWLTHRRIQVNSSEEVP